MPEISPRSDPLSGGTGKSADTSCRSGMSTAAPPLKAVSPHPWSSRGKVTVSAVERGLAGAGREVAPREPERPLLQRPFQAKAVLAARRGAARRR